MKRLRWASGRHWQKQRRVARSDAHHAAGCLQIVLLALQQLLLLAHLPVEAATLSLAMVWVYGTLTGAAAACLAVCGSSQRRRVAGMSRQACDCQKIVMEHPCNRLPAGSFVGLCVVVLLAV